MALANGHCSAGRTICRQFRRNQARTVKGAGLSKVTEVRIHGLDHIQGVFAYLLKFGLDKSRNTSRQSGLLRLPTGIG
jgi:hypothetical protein